MQTTIEWHRLVDGDPPEIGRYIVAQPSCAQIVIYWGGGRWSQDVSFASHWAKEPHPLDGDAPQLFTPAGQAARAASDELASWQALGKAMATNV